MRLTTFAPLGFAGLVLTAGLLAAVSPASAAGNSYMSDSQYLAAARCAGIAQGLGADASAYDKVLDDQSGGRETFVTARAGSSREDAAREARHAGPDTKAHLSAELGGVCHAISG